MSEAVQGGEGSDFDNALSEDIIMQLKEGGVNSTVFYVGVTDDKNVVIITENPGKKPSYEEQYVVSVGLSGNMERLVFTKFERLRDGGSTYIEGRAGDGREPEVISLIPIKAQNKWMRDDSPEVKASLNNKPLKPLRVAPSLTKDW